MSNAVVDLYINNPESDWNVYKIPSVDEQPAKPIVYDNTRQFMVVTAGVNILKPLSDCLISCISLAQATVRMYFPP